MITIEIPKNNKLDNASKLPLPPADDEIDDKPIDIPATHIETFIHFKNVRSLAKNNFGFTFFAPSLSNLADDACWFPPKIANNVLDNGFAIPVAGAGGRILPSPFNIDIPFTWKEKKRDYDGVRNMIRKRTDTI